MGGLTRRGLFGNMIMNKRERGFYWVDWTHFADAEIVETRPGPLIGEWDGKYWWFARMQTYRFDSEVRILAHRIASPADRTRLPHNADSHSDTSTGPSST
jgi:hypothetical protein